jgi:hypothetical protein
LIRFLTVIAGASALAASNGGPDSMNPAFLSEGSGKFSKLFLILGNCYLVDVIWCILVPSFRRDWEHGAREDATRQCRRVRGRLRG